MYRCIFPANIDKELVTVQLSVPYPEKSGSRPDGIAHGIAPALLRYPSHGDGYVVLEKPYVVAYKHVWDVQAP